MCLIIGPNTIKNIYEKCLQEQLEIYAYSSKDHEHIYLNKYYIMLDTILRMLRIYSELITKIDNIKQIIIYKFKIQTKVLPLKTLITNNFQEHTHNISLESVYQQLSIKLNLINKLMSNDYKNNYKQLEEFLINNNALTLNSTTLNSKPKAIIKTNEYYKHLAYNIDKDLSYLLAILQTRLTEDEIDICINEFLAIIGKNNQQKLLTSYVECNEENVLSYAINKSKNKYKFYAIIVDKTCTKFNVDPRLRYYNQDMTFIDVQKLYELNVKYKYNKNKYKFIIKDITKNDIKSLYKLNVNIQSIRLIYQYIYNKYNGCVLYINTYTQNGYANLDSYLKFRTPYSEYFDDDDFGICSYDLFEESTTQIIKEFSQRFGYNINY